MMCVSRALVCTRYPVHGNLDPDIEKISGSTRVGFQMGKKTSRFSFSLKNLKFMSGHKITRGHTDGTLTVVTAVNDESTLVDPRPFPFMGTDPDTHMVKDSGSTNRGKENVEFLSLLLRVRTRRSPHFGDFQALDELGKSSS